MHTNSDIQNRKAIENKEKKSYELEDELCFKNKRKSSSLKAQ